jgi:hypothetical protein
LRHAVNPNVGSTFEVPQEAKNRKCKVNIKTIEPVITTKYQCPSDLHFGTHIRQKVQLLVFWKFVKKKKKKFLFLAYKYKAKATD